MKATYTPKITYGRYVDNRDIQGWEADDIHVGTSYRRGKGRYDFVTANLRVPSVTNLKLEEVRSWIQKHKPIG